MAQFVRILLDKATELAHYLLMPQHNAAASKSHERANQHSPAAATADEAKAIQLAQRAIPIGGANPENPDPAGSPRLPRQTDRKRRDHDATLPPMALYRRQSVEGAPM